ncbi:hypothetical protein PSTT_00018 [Puccinia striiformis]|uniref:dolichyl-phosphate beta-glucosyltransferase n=1 Tax=Puccinia striiformis TaxID=27350 RepID=A0A2S4W7Y3_9BASI|nr:hypothetical protein PSTT_00018 [Puccinia striiformis]
MWDILLWSILSLPILYFLTIFILKRVSHQPAPPTPESLYYLSAERQERPGDKLVGILSEEASIKLSVIVPAYNEENRLNTGLTEALDWLEERRTDISTTQDPDQIISSYEVLIRTNHHPDTQVRVISLGKNRGKGGAVRHGILHARGELILFVDADGATKFSDLSKLISSLRAIQVQSPVQFPTTKPGRSEKKKGKEEIHGIAIGSRAHLVSSPTVVSRTKFRNFLMNGFHVYIFILGLQDIRDTQCGFKLMTRDTAIRVVDGLHVEGWIFDVELLLRAKLISNPKIPIVEVPIQWQEIQGSKLSIVKDSIIMAIELFLLRINYLLGVWDLS